jgi:hypothetical protein
MRSIKTCGLVRSESKFAPGRYDVACDALQAEILKR